MRILRSYLAGVSLCLGLTGLSFAQQRAAELLPPQPSTTFIPRASSDLLPSDETPPPIPKAKPRNPNFQYPPTYSKRNDLSFSGVRDRLTSIRIFGSDEKKPATAQQPAAKQPVQQTSAMVAVHGRPGTVVQTPPPIVAVAGPVPTTIGDPPAWHWYGYGAPVPGKNPYAPEGVYGQVHPNWYYQNGATPGAIPKPLLPILPFPTTDEPPMHKSNGSAEALPLAPVPETKSEVKPASLELPLPQVGSTSRNR